MPFNTYYEDELAFLRDMGAAFARAYPRLAPFLASQGNDPDVERLLEGFAFLTGRLRQKLDDELPEVTHALISLLWPHFLRPLPCMSLLRFDPIPHLVSEHLCIPHGTEVDSVPLEDTRCRFRTCYDVDLYPLTLEAVEARRAGSTSQLILRFACSAQTTAEQLNLNTVRLYLHGELFVCQSLYLWLCSYLDTITVQPSEARRHLPEGTIPQPTVRPVGFAEQEGLLPYPPNSFLGYRLLQEYFALPSKFLFVDLAGLQGHLARLEGERSFDVVCTFSRPLGERVRPTTAHVSLYCTPIINLFTHDADPLRLDSRQVEYQVRPSGRPPEHFEIYAIDRVMGWIQGSGEQRIYHPFLAFDRRATGNQRQAMYYRARLKPAILGQGTDTYLTFVTTGDTRAFPESETIALTLTCTNRDLPEQLRPGDISVPTSSSPTSARFANITGVTPAVSPMLDEGLPWQLISNLTLHYTSLADVTAVRHILSTYNFQRHFDAQAARDHERRMDALQVIRTAPIDRVFKGSPIRGVRITLEVRSSRFLGEGDLYLFATILNEFFALYTTLNSFHQLVVYDSDQGETYTWPAKIGQQPLL